MKLLSVYDTLNVTQISERYPKLWDGLREAIDNLPADAPEVTDGQFAGKPGVLLDFRGVELSRPWRSERFKQFFSDPNIYLRLYTSQETADTINTMCRIGGLEDSRVENIDIRVELPKKATPQEIRVGRLADLFGSAITENYKVGSQDKFAYLEMSKAVSQVTGRESAMGIEQAVLKHSKETGLKEYHIDFGNLIVAPSTVQDVSRIVTDLGNQGITLSVFSRDSKTTERFRLWLSQSVRKECTEEQRLEILQDTTPKGFVGMLTRYRHTGRRDEFGRSGDGEAVACQPAIYLGVRTRGAETMAVFKVFTLKTFMPRLHWAMDNDGDEHPGLLCKTIEVPLMHLGIHGMYMGRFYHFREPTLQTLEDLVTTYTVVVSDGTDGYEKGDHVVHVVRVSLPQHIKNTLDDFGVKYDKKTLMTSIWESQRTLNLLGFEQPKLPGQPLEPGEYIEGVGELAGAVDLSHEEAEGSQDGQ